ncbi:MAG: glutathione S-transferase family protein [Pseudomonadales bacterium]|nr:glutathione S-transferase family protein [Pseudomonadales bacterium]
MKLELYGSYTSPFVRHCRIAMSQASLDYALIETDQQQSDSLVSTKKVPFLDISMQDQNLRLTDSSSILRFIREHCEQIFLPSLQSLEHFCFINTQLDAAANVFYLEKFGLNSSDNHYIARQHARIKQGLESLEEMQIAFQADDDVSLRLACYLDWGIFRQRFSLSHLPNLQQCLHDANAYTAFQQTSPTE